MKTRLLVAALGLFALTAPPATAQVRHDMHGHPAAAASVTPANATARMSDGTVRKIDKAGGKITITHGPLENLGMPAMTMAFRAGDATMLDKVREGDRIRFVAKRVEGVFSVKTLEVVK